MEIGNPLLIGERHAVPSGAEDFAQHPRPAHLMRHARHLLQGKRVIGVPTQMIDPRQLHIRIVRHAGPRWNHLRHRMVFFQQVAGHLYAVGLAPSAVRFNEVVSEKDGEGGPIVVSYLCASGAG